MYVLSLETPSESKKPARTNQSKDISLVGTSSNNKENRVEEGHAKTQENKATVQTLTQQVNNSRKLQVKDLERPGKRPCKRPGSILGIVFLGNL